MSQLTSMFWSSKEKIKEVTAWIKKQPFYCIERQTCGSDCLDPEVVQKLEKVIDDFNSKQMEIKKVVMNVKPHLLFKVYNFLFDFN